MPRKRKVVPLKKTDEKRVEAVVAEAEENSAPVLEVAPDAPDAAEQKKNLALEDLKIGYVVGLTDGGEFVFELFGQDKGLVELLGINQHANKRVDRIYEDAQLTGDRLTHEVGKAIALVNQKVDQLLAVVAPKKPDNKL